MRWLCGGADDGCHTAGGAGKDRQQAGFTLTPGTATIVLMRPEIAVGAQSTGGAFEPNADWTDQARENLGLALAQAQGQLGNEVVNFVEPVGQGAATAHEYRALFTALADSVITYQFLPGNRLPTKKRDGSFLWSIGPEVAKLPGLQGADYACSSRRWIIRLDRAQAAPGGCRRGGGASA